MKRRLEFMSPEADEVVRLAVARAIERHRRRGESIVVLHDGKVVEIPPELIPPLDETPLPDAQPLCDEAID